MPLGLSSDVRLAKRLYISRLMTFAWCRSQLHKYLKGSSESWNPCQSRAEGIVLVVGVHVDGTASACGRLYNRMYPNKLLQDLTNSLYMHL